LGSEVIKVENLSKLYRLGVWGTGTLKDDIKKQLAKWSGRADPTATVGSDNQLDKIDQQVVWALKSVNFEVRQGEVLGIIGKNGAGKSTLLKILSEITAPTTGAIKLKGRVASLLEVGTGMHPELTGRENIYLNGSILGMKRWEIKNKFDAIVDFAGIAKYVDTPIKRYSSGMSVRLGFAIAAFLEPEILIVDEVLAVGDAEFQRRALGKIKEVSQGNGRTVLFVSHNMASVLNISTSCLMLSQGSVAGMGDSQRITSSYLSTDSNLYDFRKKIVRKPYLEILNYRFAGPDARMVTMTSKENKELEILIDLNIFNEDDRLNIGFLVRNELGDNVQYSFSTDMDESRWIRLSRGIHRIKTYIDTSSLNEGTYFVYLLSSIHCVEMLVSEADSICLKFELLGNRGDSPFWFNKRNSILAPYTKWHEIE